MNQERNNKREKINQINDFFKNRNKRSVWKEIRNKKLEKDRKKQKNECKQRIKKQWKMNAKKKKIK